MRSEILEFIKTKNPKQFTNWVKRQPFKDEFINLYPQTDNCSEKLYLYINNMSDIPTKPCGNKQIFKTYFEGYREFCGPKNTCECSRINQSSKLKNFHENTSDQEKEESIKKQKQTKLDRYGDSTYANREKAKQTNLKKYGTESPFASEFIKKKISKTNRIKYGVDTPFQSKEIRQKGKETFKKNHPDKDQMFFARQEANKIYNGNPFQHPDIKKKIKQKLLDEYGVGHVRQRHLKKEDVDFFNDLEKFTDFMKDKTAFEAAEILNYEINTIRKRCKENNIPYKKYEVQWELEMNELLTQHVSVVNRNTKSIIPPLELDFYLPEHNLAIELNGLFYHSEEMLLERKRDPKTYHYMKYIMCKEKGIKLIQIFEDEWYYKKDVMINYITNALKVNNNVKKINARDCTIELVTYSDASKFLESTHYLGKSLSSLFIGLKYVNELVACMAFDLKLNVWTLTRYSTKYNVRGGASRLLTYFEKTYKPISIKTFADLRFSNGELYTMMGFQQDKMIEPDYSYVIGTKRSHKFNHRKQKYDANKTEAENMKEYSKIYDAGKLRFRKTYT